MLPADFELVVALLELVESRLVVLVLAQAVESFVVQSDYHHQYDAPAGGQFFVHSD